MFTPRMLSHLLLIVGVFTVRAGLGMEISFDFNAYGRFTKRAEGEGWWQTVEGEATIQGSIIASGIGPRGEEVVQLDLKRKYIVLNFKGVAKEYQGNVVRSTALFDETFTLDDSTQAGYVKFDTLEGEVSEIVFDLGFASSEPFGPYQIRYHAQDIYGNCDLFCQPHDIWWPLGHLFRVQATVEVPTVTVSLAFADTGIKIKDNPASGQHNYVVWKDLDTNEAFYTAINDEGYAYPLLGSWGRYNVYGAVWNEIPPFRTGVRSYVHNFVSDVGEVDVKVAGGQPDVDELEISYPLPLVLVHGWNSDYGMWEKAVNYLGDYLPDEHKGYLCFACNTLHTKSCSGTIKANVVPLAAYLENTVDGRLRGLCVGGELPRVNLVTHSMGGQISRAYLQEYGEDRVANLVFIATPNGGSYSADLGFFLTNEALRRNVETNPGISIILAALIERLGNARDLTVRYARSFNNSCPYPNVRCHFFAGQININPFEPNPDDEIVYSQSLVARNGPFLEREQMRLYRALFGPEVDEILSVDMGKTLFGSRAPLTPGQTYVGFPWGWHHGIHSDECVLTDIVLALGDTEATPCRFYSTPLTATIPHATGLGADNLVVFQVALATPTEETKFIAAVGGGFPAGFHIFSFGREARFVLNDPLGATIDPQAAEADPDITYTTLPCLSDGAGGAFFWVQSYEISNPTSGEWSLRVSALPEAGPEGTPVLAVVAEPAPITLNVDAYPRSIGSGAGVGGAGPRAVDAGTSVHVAARLDLQGQPVSELSLIAKVWSPGGSEYALELWDDGGHDDGGAADLLFGGTFAETQLAGSYFIQVEARGEQMEGKVFARVGRARFAVRSSDASFGSEFSDRAEDTDADGIMDWLVLTCQLEVLKPGTYEIYGEVFDCYGVKVACAANPCLELAVGVHAVDLRFPGALLAANHVDGPFTVRGLSIVRWTNGLEIPCGQAGEVTTAPYRVPCLRLTGASMNTYHLTWYPEGIYNLQFDVSPLFPTPTTINVGPLDTQCDYPTEGQSGFFRLVPR